MDLFESTFDQSTLGKPLAERMRPRVLDDVVGQAHLAGESGLLRRLLRRGKIPSLLFWGPPGTGKTTLAEILSRELRAEFIRMSAVAAGVKEIRAAVSGARDRKLRFGKATLLFIDEIHRFNKAQQDALLPHVEQGIVTLLGATTENPSFEVNAALLSRCQVLVTKPLPGEALEAVAKQALLNADRGLGDLGLGIDGDALQTLVMAAGGDARRLLTSLEVAADLAATAGNQRIGLGHAEQAVARRILLYDKGGEEHYNVISAFIKSMRGSDPDATCHYLARMLEAGEDPRFLLRRMLIFASEDVGNADPMALQIAVAGLEAFEMIGMPEGVLALTQVATYLACAPKSNAVIKAYGRARRDLLRLGSIPIPKRLLNAPTRLMKNLGYGQGYRYPHHYGSDYQTEDLLPDLLRGRCYYAPSDSGLEQEMGARLREMRKRAGIRRRLDDPGDVPHHR